MENRSSKYTESIAFVASTLPIEILYKYMEDWNISTIVLSINSHLPSYKYLIDGKEHIKIRVLSNSIRWSILQLFFILIRIKLSGKRVVFFHECGWPWFDLFVTFLKPRGFYIPQINNSGRILLDYNAVTQRSLFAKALKWLRLHKLFNIYSQMNDGGGSKKFFFASKKYPSSITAYDEKYSRSLLSNIHVENKNTNKIIILTNRDCVLDETLINAYTKIIDKALFSSYQCFIKDHPSIQGRLNLKHERVSYIDPAIPVELIEDDFAFAFGFATAGLLFFGKRAISIINTIKELPIRERELKMQHLKGVVGEEQIIFLKNIDEELDYVFDNRFNR